MKIRYTEFALNPALRNTIAHLPQHRAVALIDSGAAVEVPMRKRGEPGWLEDMKERSEAANPNPAPATVQWSVSFGDISQRYAINAKCSRPNCGTLHFNGKPDAALESIQFLHSCGCASGPEKIPVAVAEQYRKLHCVPTTLARDEAEYWHAARPQPSLPVSPETWQYPLTGPLRPGNEPEALKNYQPNPGDGQPADLSKLSPVFKDWKRK